MSSPFAPAAFSPFAFALLRRRVPVAIGAEDWRVAESHGQTCPEARVAGARGTCTQSAVRAGIVLALALGVRLFCLLAETSVIISPLADVDLFVGVVLDLTQQVPALATPSSVEITAEVVAPLVAGLAAAILAALCDASVPIDSNQPLVEVGLVQQVHRLGGLLVGHELHEAETARRLLESVQAHDDPLHLAAFRKELVNLLLCGVEGQVPDVDRPGDFYCLGPLLLVVPALLVDVLYLRSQLLVQMRHSCEAPAPAMRDNWDGQCSLDMAPRSELE
eukprot:CAMPEP_0117551536 /NCGR_PEP_ID=MMETSP0784-20121206/49241_1 /TAXON_ID=39447 /ORGANISM="" /LENGTH=276 /DNA_ID=CAMNT_0005348577 /DNA_START=51 /DNA_END=878 /DNA_ORIENTATION=+